MDIVEGKLSSSPSVKETVEVYWISRYDYRTNWSFRLHVHDFHQMIYVIEGEGVFDLGEDRVEVSPNSLLFVPPYVPHSLVSLNTQTLRTYDIKFEVLSTELAKDLPTKGDTIQDIYGLVRAILEDLHQEAVLNEPWCREVCNALLLRILVFIARKSASADTARVPSFPQMMPRDESIRELLENIHKLSGEKDLTIEELSQLAGHSKSYLEKKFKKVMGVSLHKYVMRYRVYKAKALLRYSEEPIKNIAFMCGFKTIHHFTRVFSQSEGIPPATWREAEMQFGRKGVILSPRFENIDITEIEP